MEPPQVGDYWELDDGTQWEAYMEGGQMKQRQIAPPRNPPPSPPPRRHIVPPWLTKAWLDLIGGPVGGGSG